MGHDTFSSAAFSRVSRSVKDEGGSATHRGEQRHREGRGLDPLVDPKGFGGIRRSLTRMAKKGKFWEMLVGPAILKETRFDTTGSMGRNVELAFGSLPRSYHLLKEVENAPLLRYDLQIINAIFGDVRDNYVLCRSQAEMAEKIAEQLRLMVPEGDGGDEDEDPQYGIFGAAYLTAPDILNRGLKPYDFTVTDARGRSQLDRDTLIRVFSDQVFQWVRENGHQVSERDLPSTAEVVQYLLTRAHAFAILVEPASHVTRFWTEIYGRNRVIKIPTTEMLPEVEAAIIGLTEGTQNLQNLPDFLMKQADLDKGTAGTIRDSVAHIPLGAQSVLPDFKKIPMAGSLFRDKRDPWPIHDEDHEPDAGPEKKPGGKKPASMWH